MALIKIEYCSDCEKDTRHINGKCDLCTEHSNKIRVASWNALSTDKKLQDIRRRLEILERGPAQY